MTIARLRSSSTDKEYYSSFALRSSVAGQLIMICYHELQRLPFIGKHIFFAQGYPHQISATFALFLGVIEVGTSSVLRILPIWLESAL
jgi:hypothetical protein